MEQIKHGLRENWQQFAILVLVNAFVGGMVGMERSIFPEFAATQFGVASKTAVLSFITAFGFTKAATNYFTGRLANRFGRRNLLLSGWVLAIPVPFLLIYAPNWNWVILANVLLGMSQGLTWSSTVVMKIDLVGDKDRGLAMGLNEFAGYLAVAVVAFFTGMIADKYGVTPYPFYVGIGISIVGLLITLIWVKDTRAFVHSELVTQPVAPLKNIFWETTFRNRNLSAITQAGMVNNLNDGMIWGLLPILLFSLHFDTPQIGIITAIYPGVWGIGQLFTGKMADIYAPKALLFWGMLLQGIVILALPFVVNFYILATLSALLGFGTALVYPTFLSAIASATLPQQRAESIGVFRLWRDSGYAFGAIISGITADLFGVEYAIGLIGLITVGSAIIIKARMKGQASMNTECISIETFKKTIEGHRKIVLIDVRSEEDYASFHIPGAVHIPLQELTGKAANFDPGALLVTTCGKGGGRSTTGATLLSQLGYSARWLCGGTEGWRILQADLPH